MKMTIYNIQYIIVFYEVFILIVFYYKLSEVNHVARITH